MIKFPPCFLTVTANLNRLSLNIKATVKTIWQSLKLLLVLLIKSFHQNASTQVAQEFVARLVTLLEASQHRAGDHR